MEKSNPLVTVGIPTYNRIKGLQYTLECVMRQSYENLEILIADNCTEPKEEIDSLLNEVCNQDKRIKYFRQDSNKGSLYNFESLLRVARGKYFIWFCDDDHYDGSELIERYVEVLESSEYSSCAMGTVDYIDGSGKLFIKDSPSYRLQGSLFSRLWIYLTTDITDNLMYGMFRTAVVKNYRFEREVRTPEKFLILHLLANGPIIDCFNEGYKNIYSFKTRAEAIECMGSPILRNHTLIWVKTALRILPLPHALFFSILYMLIKVPKISWPIRKIFKLPKQHPGRTIFFNPLKEKKSE